MLHMCKLDFFVSFVLGCKKKKRRTGLASSFFVVGALQINGAVQRIYLSARVSNGDGSAVE